MTSPVKVFGPEQKFTTDGRGAKTIHIHRRVTYYNASDIPTDLYDHIIYLDRRENVIIDCVNLLDIPPVLSDVLQRLPNRNFKVHGKYWIARVCGHITIQHNPGGLCEFCIIMNALTPDFDSHLFQHQRPWIQSYFREHFPEIEGNKKLFKKACRAWQSKLNGSSAVYPTHIEMAPELENTVRERLTMIWYSQKLYVKMLEEVAEEDSDVDDGDLADAKKELDAMDNNLRFLKTLTTTQECERRIEGFLQQTNRSFMKYSDIVRPNHEDAALPPILKKLRKINPRSFKKKFAKKTKIKPIAVPKSVLHVSDLTKYYHCDGIEAFQAQHQPTPDILNQKPVSHILKGQRLFTSKKGKKSQPGRHAGPYEDKVHAPGDAIASTSAEAKRTSRRRKASASEQAVHAPSDAIASTSAEAKRTSRRRKASASEQAVHAPSDAIASTSAEAKRTSRRRKASATEQAETAVPERKRKKKSSDVILGHVSMSTGNPQDHSKGLEETDSESSSSSGTTEQSEKSCASQSLAVEGVVKQEPGLEPGMANPDLGDQSRREVSTKYKVNLVGKTGKLSDFGFTVDGGEDTNERPYIASIKPGSPAALDGSMEVGDRLLIVNTKNVKRLTKHKVLKTLKKAALSGALSLKLQRLSFSPQ